MLTSEQQKIYNVKVPKGGYGYYTLYHGIYDPENDIDERPSYAQTGDLFEPEGSSVVYKATRKNGKTTWAIAEDAQRQSESGESGSGGGSSLPSMTGKNGKVLGVTLDAQDHEQAEWVTPSGGGGAEKFVVTLTQENDTWTADKTIAEIVAADEANQVVVCKVSPSGGGMPYELPLTTAVEIAGGEGYISIFTGVIMNASGNGNDSVTVYGSYAEGQTNWLITTTPIPASTNEPLIVTLTADGSTGNFVGDKTNGEVHDAITAGQAVILSASIGSATFKLVVQYAYYDGTDYEFAFIDSSSVKNTVTGGANDYVTASLA